MDGAVEGEGHRPEDAAFRVFDVGEGLEILFGGLEGGVRRARRETANEKARRKDAENDNDVLRSRVTTGASETLSLFDKCDR